jgi:alpha-mannosidase
MSNEGQVNPEELKVHMVGHSHLDLAWLWRWDETKKDILPNTWEATLARMEAMPELTFQASQMAFYEAMEESRPDLFEKIKEKVSAGKWDVLGGMWVEMDANMPCGESMVRQVLLGQNYARERFGERCKVAFLPDTFGHAWTLPQILRKGGMEYFLFMRCAPDGMDYFWWEGIDGSRVLSGRMFWNVEINSENFDFLQAVTDYAERTGLKEILFFFGKGDHGGGIRAADLAKIEELKKRPGCPEIGFALPQEYMERLKASGDTLPVHRGELNAVFPGCYTTQSRIKAFNRRLEVMLLDAEKIAALGAFYHKITRRIRSYYPWRPLNEVWKIVLRNQFHDILPGSSTPGPVEEALRSYRAVEKKAKAVLREALQLVAGRIDTAGEGIPVVVFNTLSWERSGPAEVKVELPDEEKSFAVRDVEGNLHPCQVMSSGKVEGGAEARVLFSAQAVPAMGYSTFHIVGGKQAEPTAELSASSEKLENEFVRVSIDERSGLVSEIYDKRLKRNLLAEPGNLLEAIGDEPLRMDAWKMVLTDEVEEPELVEGPELKEAGPIRGTVRMRRRYRESWFDQEVTLYAGMPRVDFRMAANWYERRRCLKVGFVADVDEGNATFEIPYGSIDRPADGTEYPAMRWVDVSNDERGLSVLSNSRYGFDVKESRIRMTLLRGSTSPDPVADMGRHVIEYAVYPHAGRWHDAGTVMQGYEFSFPLRPIRAMQYAGLIPKRTSAMNIRPRNLVVSAIKQEEGYAGKRMVMRIYETEGKKTEGELRFRIPVKAWEANLLEETEGKVADGTDTVRLHFGPYEIKTLMLLSLEEGAGTDIYD